MCSRRISLEKYGAEQGGSGGRGAAPRIAGHSRRCHGCRVFACLVLSCRFLLGRGEGGVWEDRGLRRPSSHGTVTELRVSVLCTSLRALYFAIEIVLIAFDKNVLLYIW